MDLVNMLLNQAGGDPVRQLAGRFGLSEEQTVSAISNLVPALGQGLARNATSEGGLEGLLGALAGGGHQRYIENPSMLNQQETVLDGNGILGHILGSKDVSRQVARQASAQTGVGEDILKKMLPVVATMVMGSLSKQAPALGLQNALGGSESSGVMGMLSSFLDANQDGSVVDDVMGMVGKLFQKSGS